MQKRLINRFLTYLLNLCEFMHFDEIIHRIVQNYRLKTTIFYFYTKYLYAPTVVDWDGKARDAETFAWLLSLNHVNE